MFLTFKDRDTPFYTAFRPTSDKRESPGLQIKHTDMYYQCQCSVPFLSWLNFSCFCDVLRKFASVCLQL